MSHNFRPEPTEYDFFTGGKLPELAIAYNLAVDNLDNYIKSLLNNTDPKYKPTEHLDDLPDFVFPYLRHYLWKGNNENKNSAGYELTPEAKRIIKKMIEKLKRIRNFHSHVWHTNEMMEFDNELVHFIMDRHEIACAKLIEEHAKTVDTTVYFEQLGKLPFFKKERHKSYIFIHGRVFFLSFFLNKGEMQSLLQSMQGYKRTNAPEFMFKHKVFTFYCHREGSSWDSTGVDNTELEQKNEDEQQRILNGRQAYRIFNYLKDIPAISKDKTLPLVLANGSWVGDMNTLIEFITEKNLLPGYKFYKKDSADTDDDIADEKKRNEAQKVVEKKERDGFRHFRVPGHEDYEFEISYGTLRHITTDIFLDDNDESLAENPSRKHFAEVLRLSIEYRRYIYDQLLKAGEEPVSFEKYKVTKKYSSIYINYDEYQDAISDAPYTANEWRHISISATPNTERLLVQWLAEFTNGTAEKPTKQEYNKRLKLLNAIRSSEVAFNKTPYEGILKNGREKKLPNTDPHPLLFHLGYYYREDDIKLRKKDYFIEWAIRYFIDSNLLPDAYFEKVVDKSEEQQEASKIIYKLKRKTIWVNNPKADFSFRIADNQINIGIEKGGKIYRLRLGEKVIKYLLLWHFRGENKEDKSIQGFLEAVAEDLAIIHSDTADKINMASLQMLEAFSIPPVLFKTRVAEVNEKGSTVVMYETQVTKYLEANLKWIKESLDKQPKLNRNQKNAIILDAYRLFDFTHTQGSKFLRKNEYEQMSICHFMLNQNKQKVYGLICNVFMLEERLPKEIKDILDIVIKTKDYNLDNLFEIVLNNRKDFFKKKLGDTEKNYHQLAYLNIHFDDNNMDDESLAARNQLRTKMLTHTPFAIHPALTLKYFYPDKYAKGVFKKESDSHENLFLKLREEPQLKQWLSFGTLRTEPVEKILFQYRQAFDENKEIIKYQKAWTGTANDVKTKDILLLLVGKEYLKMYDANLATEFEKLLVAGNKDFETLMKEEVIVSISINKDFQIKLDPQRQNKYKNGIQLKLRMHQLDDYFFRNQKEKMKQLAIYYINNRNEELALYDNEVKQKIEKWPDGSEANPLTLGNLVEARRINAEQAKELVQYLFDYERNLIATYCATDNKIERQRKMELIKAKDGLYVSFWQILQLDTTNPQALKDKLKELRINSLHSLIPQTGSYRQQTMPNTPISETLNIHNRLGKDRTDSNPYNTENNEEVAIED